MKESYQFHTINEEIQRKKANKEEIKPRSSQEKIDSPLRGAYLDLLASLQPKIAAEEEIADEIADEQIKTIKEVITPQLHQQMIAIYKQLNFYSKKTEEHPDRELVDLENESVKEQISSWIENLKREVRSNPDFNADDVADIEALSWRYFDAFAQVINAKSVEKDITEFYSQRQDELADPEKEKFAKVELNADLKQRYGLSPAEVEIIVDLIQVKDSDDYNINKVFNALQQIWVDYKLGDKKKELLKISLGFLLAKGLWGFTPSLFKNIMAGDHFNCEVLIEYYGINRYAMIMEEMLAVEVMKINKDINAALNKKISDSLFFQEFEFIHDKSLGEVYTTLRNGKDSTTQLVGDFSSKFAPIIVGLGMSGAFLTKMNPALGAIGLSSVPLMFHLAKKQNQKMRPMHSRARKEETKIASELAAVKEGFEQIRTSENIPDVSAHLKEQLDKGDLMNFEKEVEKIKMRITRNLPYFYSTIIAALVGAAFQQRGLLSGGEVFSSVLYAQTLQMPMQELVDLYYNRFSSYTQDIDKMNEILGQYEKLDLPEGEKEQLRKAVTELENFDIEIKNLQYKGILEGINLVIKQGEFLGISGESGAGKSTLLRNIVGLFKPEKGEVKIGNEKIDDIKKYGSESIYSVMSYSNQSPIIFPQMTVRDNLLLWAKDKKSDQQIRQVLKELRLTDLGDRLDEKAPYLSGGEKVRFGLARTLLKNPKIMLLDEPTSSLDSRSADEVRELIAKIHQEHKDITIICVSHDEDLLEKGDRQIEIKKRSKKNNKL